MPTYFREGFKFTDGVRYTPTLMQKFPSSNGYTVYTAIQWSDGTRSCNCPGWSFKRTKGGALINSCRHVRELYAGSGVTSATPQDVAEAQAEAEQSQVTMRRRIEL